MAAPRGKPFNSERAKAARAKASPRGENKIKSLFKEYADEDDVKQLFDVLKGKAVKGDMDAIKTMLAYLIGKPKESLDITTGEEPLTALQVEILKPYETKDTK